MKKIFTRKTILIAVAVLLAAATTVTVIVLVPRSPGEARIVFFEKLPDAVLPAFDQELSVFRGLFPRTTLTLANDPATESDVSLLGGFPDDLSRWADTPVPWSGEVWVLALQKKVMSSLDDSTASALRAGTMGSKDFEVLLGRIANQKLSPITLGNSHEWPFTMWVQVWAAMRLGPDRAQRLPDTSPIAASDFTQVLNDLKTWKKQDWFDTAAWSQDWAKGLSPLAEGKAAMALVNSAMLGALSAEARQGLELLPIPRGDSGSEWSIGNVQFLAVSKQSRFPDQARELVRFLTSPGVTERLVVKTGRPFLSWNAKTTRTPTVLGAWAGRANEAGFQDLVKALQ